MANEKVMTISGHRVIANVQCSEIGYSYGRLFIEEKPGQTYINFDLTLGATFSMKQSDWEDWLADAELVEDEQKMRQTIRQLGVNYDILAEVLEAM